MVKLFIEVTQPPMYICLYLCAGNSRISIWRNHFMIIPYFSLGNLDPIPITLDPEIKMGPRFINFGFFSRPYSFFNPKEPGLLGSLSFLNFLTNKDHMKA